MRNLKIYLFVSMLLMSISVFASYPPSWVRAAFKKMYPEVVDAEWTKKGDYHVADFMKNGHELGVWFNNKAKWLMTETSVESLGSIPEPVAKAFMQTTLASMVLEEVTIVTFPKQPTVIVIKVRGHNSFTEYQVFYAPDGKLLQTLNVTQTGGEIYPGLFD